MRTFPVVLALVACASAESPKLPASPAHPPAPGVASASPLFTATEPAPQGSALRVFVEPAQLVGWIAGSASFAGATAKIELDGRVEVVRVEPDNTFGVAYRVTRSTEAIVRVGNLVQRVTVEPTPANDPAHSTAFFVVDRPAYRPGQKLAFTAFLRRLDDTRASIQNARVEVQIVSDTRKTTAAKLAVVSDANGRIHGEYTFSSGDPLDGYTLSIPGYRGTAHVTLAEYRKSKVKLDADAVISARAAQLQFRALDFLDAPVPGGHVTFTAQIVHDADTAPATLDTTRFALARSGARWSPSPHQQRWLVAHPESLGGAIYHAGARVVDEVRGKVTLDASGTGGQSIPLRAEYLRGEYRLLVDAVIVEPNGREQRTTRAIPLARSDVRVQLSTADALVGTGHPVAVAVRVVDSAGREIAPASASIAALRMDPPRSLDPFGYDGWSVDANGWNGGWNGGNGWNANANLVLGAASGAPACRYTAMGCRSLSRWQRTRARRAPLANPTEKLAATVAVSAGTARFALDDPGAYRLVANVVFADGSSTWSELGIAVRERELLPPLVLDLDRDEVRQGEHVTARVQGRHRDGAVLVVLRDARGIQARQRVVLVNGQARIDLPTGDALGYGAIVEAHALVGADEVVVAQEQLRVVPSKRELAIRTTAKPTYGPGEQVELEIAVDPADPASRDRVGQVDLVVTAYDQSLLGVAADRSTDPRDFYLADDRAWSRAAIDALRVELGDITIGALVARARGIAKRTVADDDQAALEEHAEATRILELFDRGVTLTTHSVAALLGFAGVSASTDAYARWSMPVGDRKALLGKRVIDLLTRDMATLAFVRVADATVITDPSAVAITGAHGGFVPTGSRRYARGDASGNASFSAGGNASFSARPIAPAPIGMIAGGRAGPAGLVRRDFSDSAFWSASTRTGPDGKARVSFKLPDSLTSWRVVVTAVSDDLRVGRHATSLKTVRDIMVWPMLPRQFTAGDTLTIFATVHNTTAADRDIAVELAAEHVDVLSPVAVTVRVPRGKNVPVSWSVRAREPGMARLRMSASTPNATGSTAPTAHDASEKLIPIVPSAAEQLVTASGFTTKPLVVELPDGVDPRHAKLEITFAPSLAADMVDTLGYLVEYPYGCAEQTMSRFAPAIRVAGILDNLGLQQGPLRQKLPGVVAAGMKRLVELQQPDGGWGWIGSGTTHEMITPYVVWGLVEAEKAGYKLPDAGTLNRGFERVRSLAQALDGDAHLADRVYLAYVYSQRHAVPAPMWRSIVAAPEKLSDYALALALEIAVARRAKGNSDDTATADRLAKTLRSRVRRTSIGAHWVTSKFSRWGEDPFETTAAALKALVAYDVDDPLVAEAVAYFVATKRGDRWNSTKDTAMILYAMTELLARKQVARSSDAFVDFTLDGKPRSQRVAFTDGLAREVTIDGAALQRRTTIAFPKASPGTMARAVLRYRKSGRDLAPAAHGLTVERQLFLVDAKGARVKQLKTGDRVRKGAYVESAVTVVHGHGQPNAQTMRFLLIEDPKPAGAEALPHDDPRFPRVPTPWVLREDRESHVAFHHEEVGPTTTARTFMHLEMGGELVIAPAHAELMYQTATRGHSGSFVLRVQ